MSSPDGDAHSVDAYKSVFFVQSARESPPARANPGPTKIYKKLNIPPGPTHSDTRAPPDGAASTRLAADS